jgi:hypothetical protein
VENLNGGTGLDVEGDYELWLGKDSTCRRKELRVEGLPHQEEAVLTFEKDRKNVRRKLKSSSKKMKQVDMGRASR